MYLLSIRVQTLCSTDYYIIEIYITIVCKVLVKNVTKYAFYRL